MGDRILKKICREPSIKNYPVIYPNYTTISLKNIKRAVLANFDPNEHFCSPNVYNSDVREKHIPNRRLLDLPFSRPKCCSDIYNVMVDREKLKKLKKFDMSRSVRTFVSNLEEEEAVVCIPDVKDTDPTNHLVDECYLLSESEDDSEDEDMFIRKKCSSGSLSRCSGCSTLGELEKPKVHVRRKLNWRKLLHGNAVETCKHFVTDIMTKYKGNPQAELKLKKRLLLV